MYKYLITIFIICFLYLAIKGMYLELRFKYFPNEIDLAEKKFDKYFNQRMKEVKEKLNENK